MPSEQYQAQVQHVVEAVFTQGVDSLPEVRQAVFSYAKSVSCAAQPIAQFPTEWQPYLDKVIQHAYRITDEEAAALQYGGHSEEEIFELTITAALGAGLARLECGLAALHKVKGVQPCG